MQYYLELVPYFKTLSWLDWRRINEPFCVIYALMVSWYPKRRPSYSIANIMLDLDPWGSPSVIEVIKEASEAPCLMKKPMKTWNP